jgi:hypothetical protein
LKYTGIYFSRRTTRTPSFWCHYCLLNLEAASLWRSSGVIETPERGPCILCRLNRPNVPPRPVEVHEPTGAFGTPGAVVGGAGGAVVPLAGGIIPGVAGGATIPGDPPPPIEPPLPVVGVLVAGFGIALGGGAFTGAVPGANDLPGTALVGAFWRTLGLDLTAGFGIAFGVDFVAGFKIALATFEIIAAIGAAGAFAGAFCKAFGALFTGAFPGAKLFGGGVGVLGREALPLKVFFFPGVLVFLGVLLLKDLPLPPIAMIHLSLT